MLSPLFQNQQILSLLVCVPNSALFLSGLYSLSGKLDGVQLTFASMGRVVGMIQVIVFTLTTFAVNCLIMLAMKDAYTKSKKKYGHPSSTYPYLRVVGEIQFFICVNFVVAFSEFNMLQVCRQGQIIFSPRIAGFGFLNLFFFCFCHFL